MEARGERHTALPAALRERPRLLRPRGRASETIRARFVSTFPSFPTSSPAVEPQRLAAAQPRIHGAEHHVHVALEAVSQGALGGPGCDGPMFELALRPWLSYLSGLLQFLDPILRE